MKANLHNKEEYIQRLSRLIENRNLHEKDTDTLIINDALIELYDAIYNEEYSCEPWENH